MNEEGKELDLSAATQPESAEEIVPVLETAALEVAPEQETAALEVAPLQETAALEIAPVQETAAPQLDAKEKEADHAPEDHDHEVIESDEEEHDEHAHSEEETPDYAHMDNQLLLRETEKLVREGAVQKIKSRLEEIKSVLFKNLDEVRQEKLADFLEDGGNALDFEYNQPERAAFRAFYQEFRNKRKAFYDELEAKLNQNLLVKQNLVERLKELATKEDSIGDSFKEFRDIQEKWHQTGPVPRQESQNLWQTFKHFEEAFYDFIRISKELRDLDFKRNLEAKEALIIQAEALATEAPSAETFLKLQALHKKWKAVGPVDSEHREPVWQRFSEVTKKIHDSRKIYLDGLQEEKEALLQQKAAIAEQMRILSETPQKTHGQWKKASDEMEVLRESFKKVGRINHPNNDALWDAFRAANRTFNNQKNEFYKSQKREQLQNMERKRTLLAKAVALQESEDWKETAAELKRIQNEWKKIGYVPRPESDKIWDAFRDACNYFFNRLTAHNKNRDTALYINLEAKKALLEKVTAIETTTETGEAVNELKEIIGAWKAAGTVPREERNIEHQFSNVLDAKFKELKINRQEAKMIRFENRLHELVESDNHTGLNKEIDQLQHKIDEQEKELRQLENNITFFSNANSKNPLVKEVAKKIERLREDVDVLKAQRKLLAEARRNAES